jgi:hypothetical protein
MASEPLSFGLRSWRRPAREQVPLLVPLAAIYLVVGVPVLGVLFHLLGVSIRPALVLAAGVVAVLVVAVVWVASRTQPAGALRLGDGRLRFDAWRGGPTDAPLSAVRSAVVTRYEGGRLSPVLVIRLPRRRIYVHEPRLADGTLEEVLGALHGALDERDHARVVAASASTAGRQQGVTGTARRVAVVAGGIAAALAVLRLLLELV